ncbi:MAG: DUF2993 domain-containing protein [Actinomycetota bacterium]|nr:DUF2993 domain-containing protein [Actinomycetota bacterium]
MVLILAGGAVAVDAIARDRVEARVAEEVAASFGLDSRPDVEISGTAFLPQVLGGSVERVVLSADAATLGTLPMEDVVVTLSGVSPREPFVADVVDFEGVVPLSAVQELNSTEIDIRIQDGAVVVGGAVLGVPLEAHVTPVADGRAVVARLDTVTLAGLSVAVADLPASVAQAIGGVRVPIDALPEGLTLTHVTVGLTGFHVEASGTKVALAP